MVSGSDGGIAPHINKEGARAYYVAPIWEVRGRRLRQVGERLTGLLPADPDSVLYYTSFPKNFRLASTEEIRRFRADAIAARPDLAGDEAAEEMSGALRDNQERPAPNSTAPRAPGRAAR